MSLLNNNVEQALTCSLLYNQKTSKNKNRLIGELMWAEGKSTKTSDSVQQHCKAHCPRWPFLCLCIHPVLLNPLLLLIFLSSPLLIPSGPSAAAAQPAHYP